MPRLSTGPRPRACLAGVRAYTPGRPIDEVQRALGLRRVIKLASNENALGPSPKALTAARQALAQVHRYPDAGGFLLRRRLARHLRVRPEELILGNGSDELLVLVLRAFVEPGDEVVVADPTFLIYDIAATACGARVIKVPLRHYRYDLAAMRRAITRRTKVVFIANPDNPTGTYVTRQEVARFLDGWPRGVVACFDEAYYEFVTARDYPQTIPLVRRLPLFVTRSFSKAYGLAGLRIGYGIGSPALVRWMDRVREPFNVNLVAQQAALAALDDRGYLARTRALLRQGYAYVTEACDRLGLRYVPSVTNFLLIETGPRSRQIAQQLLRRGVIVREMSAWGLDQCIRVTLGTMTENRQCVRALTQSLR